MITSSSQSVPQRPLIISMKTFNISSVSTTDAFASVLSFINVTADLNGTIVQCTDVGDSLAESDTSMTISSDLTLVGKGDTSKLFFKN